MVLLAAMGTTLIIAATSLVTTGLTIIGNFWVERYKKKNEPDLSDPDFEDRIKDVLDLIKDEMKSCRVSYWEGSNGTNTLSGYHLKKLSMMGESNKPGYHDIKDEMHMIPISTFKRHMDLLKESEDGVIFSVEKKYHDDLANLNMSYGVNSVYVFQVKTVFNKWTGVLSVGFDDPILLDEQKLAWLKIQASRIGILIKTKQNK